MGLSACVPNTGALLSPKSALIFGLLRKPQPREEKAGITGQSWAVQRSALTAPSSAPATTAGIASARQIRIQPRMLRWHPPPQQLI